MADDRQGGLPVVDRLERFRCKHAARVWLATLDQGRTPTRCRRSRTSGVGPAGPVPRADREIGGRPRLFRSASFSTNTLRILTAAAACFFPGLPFARARRRHAWQPQRISGSRHDSDDVDETRYRDLSFGWHTCRNLVEAAARMRHDHRQTPAHCCTQQHQGGDRPLLVFPGQAAFWLVRRSAPDRIRTCAHGSGGRCSIP